MLVIHGLSSAFGANRNNSSRDSKDPVASRAYVAFANIDALVAFSTAYDGWMFRDKAGRVSNAVVEFAPNQKTPPAKAAKKDPKQGTIDQGKYLCPS